MRVIRAIGAFLWAWGAQASGAISVLMLVVGHFAGWNGDTVFKYTTYGAFLLCVVLQGIKIRRFEDLLSPKFVLECDSRNNPSCKSDTSVNYSAGPRVYVKQAVFLRMIVSVKSPLTIKGCRATILSVEKSGKELLKPDKLEVGFTHCPKEEKFCKIVSNGVPDFVDVMLIEEDHDLTVNRGDCVIRIPVERTPNSLNFQKIFTERGDYFISIVVTGENVASASARLKFTWTGDAGTSELVRVR